MNWHKTQKLLSLVCRLILGFIFIYAAVGKIVEPEVFAKEIMNYRLVSEVVAKVTAITLPWLELFIGILLLFGVKTKTSSMLSSCILIIFTFGVLSAIARGLNINCGCVSHHIEYVGWKKVLENLALIFASIYLALFPISYLSFEKHLSNENAKDNRSN